MIEDTVDNVKEKIDEIKDDSKKNDEVKEKSSRKKIEDKYEARKNNIIDDNKESIKKGDK